jgi:hypothetical protein
MRLPCSRRREVEGASTVGTVGTVGTKVPPTRKWKEVGGTSPVDRGTKGQGVHCFKVYIAYIFFMPLL